MNENTTAKEPYVKFFEEAPEIPVKLLQLHEEGKVVFFCGAGISYPAGLPGFKDLVLRIHKHLNHIRPKNEQNLLRNHKYDELLDILEWNIANGKNTMRQALYDVLQPNLSVKINWKTHAALLDLATVQDDAHSVHLVTTNFDRIFEYVIHRKKRTEITTYCAPFLPNPRPSSWNGLVYLHGLLPEQNDNEETLRRLVVTSGDFGLAYLKERWASRFVTEILRYYTICFVGYSIADPVMKYLMDAVAAEKLLGEIVNPIFMFCPDDPKNKKQEASNKVIRKIYYNSRDNHIILHKMLQEWSAIYHDGETGKIRIIDQYAGNNPSTTNNADAATSKVLWALQSGGISVLNRFANHKPLPPFEWLELIEEQCCKSYLPKQQWRHLGLVQQNSKQFSWELLPTCIGNWLIRYLNDSRFVLWVIESGGHLRPTFKHDILTRLHKYRAKLTELPQHFEKEVNSKSDIPEELLEPLWHMIVEGKVISYKHCNDCDDDYCILLEYLKGDLSTILLQKIREFFTPKIVIHEAWHEFSEKPFDWELTLESSCAKNVADSLKEQYQGSFHLFLPVLSAALKDGLDALSYLGESVDERTGFTLRIPSIEEHTQNHTHSCELQVLVDLIRDAWLACSKINIEQATIMAKAWISSPYVLFQRIALYAASKDNFIPPAVWADWLYQNNRLWENNFTREVLRLLATQAKKLSKKELEKLTNIILAGPPEAYLDKFNFSFKDKAWYFHRYIWLRLAKLNESKCLLSVKAKKKYEAITNEHPEWKLGPNQKEEFSSWCCGTGDPDYEAEIEHIFVPRTLDGLTKWLNDDIASQAGNDRRCFAPEDDWKTLCRQDARLTLEALLKLIKEGKWNIQRIDSALETWRIAGNFVQGNKLLKVVIESASENTIEKLAREIAFYCGSALKDKSIGEELLLLSADRLFSLSYDDCSIEKMNSFENYDPLNISLNHAIGMITQTLLDSCFADKIKPNAGIDDRYRVRFEQLCDCSQLKYRHGRFALATRSIALFHANPDWAKKYIVPLFDWAKDEHEAASAWYGFLWNAAIYQPFLIELRKSIIEMLKHIGKMPQIRQNYLSLLLGCWYYRVKGYSIQLIKSFFVKFDKECLLCAAVSLAEHLRRTSIESTDKRFSTNECWDRDILPIIRLWPQEGKLLTDEIRGQLSLIVFYSGEKMDEARKQLQWALDILADTDHFLYQIDDNPILEKYPKKSLQFLYAIIRNPKWGQQEALKKCLKAIEKGDPLLKQDLAFQDLNKMVNTVP